MRRISPNNPVRRCLFPDEHTDEAKTDNFVNVLQESIAADLKLKKEKWNFDFENDVPLEGNIEWFRGDGVPNDWIGVTSKTDTNDNTEIEKTEEDDLLQMKKENEVTPRSIKEDEAAPLLRKRRSENNLKVTAVKRKISFD